MFSSAQDQKIYGSVTVNAKGQIVLPVEARKQLNIKAGDKLLITTKGDKFIGIIKADTLEDFINQIQSDIDQTKSLITNGKAPKTKKITKKTK